MSRTVCTPLGLGCFPFARSHRPDFVVQEVKSAVKYKSSNNFSSHLFPGSSLSEVQKRQVRNSGCRAGLVLLWLLLQLGDYTATLMRDVAIQAWHSNVAC